MRIRVLLIGTALSCFALVPPALAQPPQPGPPGRQTTPGGEGARASQPSQEEGVQPVEKVTTTQHTATIGG
jgi:hypothetical protein